MNARQTAILSAAVILPVVAILLLRDSPDTSSAGVRTAPPHRPQRSSPVVRKEAPRFKGEKDFQTFVQKVTMNEFRLSAREIDQYLESRDRDVESLLVAFRMTLDKALIDEALEKSPDDPEVLLCALRICSRPEERLKLIESLKRNDPGNGLGYCLAARVLVDLGRDQEAVAELAQSAGKPIDDFMVRNCQSDEEAYLSAGYSPLEAKAAALFGGTKPSLMQMGKPLFSRLDALRQEHERAGNPAEAQSMRDLQARIGQSLQQGGTIVDSLVGIAYERNAWNGIGSSEAVAYLSEIGQRKDAMIGKSRQVEELSKDTHVPDTDWLLYLDRVKLFGEQAANDWMLQRHPGH